MSDLKKNCDKFDHFIVLCQLDNSIKMSIHMKKNLIQWAIKKNCDKFDHFYKITQLTHMVLQYNVLVITVSIDQPCMYVHTLTQRTLDIDAMLA